jgi:hypothetical protein
MTGNILNLYKVKLELEICVMSDSSENSINIAKFYAPGEIEEFARATSSVVKNKNDISPTWVNNIPYYSPQKNKSEIKTCGQIIEEIKEASNKNDNKNIDGKVENYNLNKNKKNITSTEITEGNKIEITEENQTTKRLSFNDIPPQKSNKSIQRNKLPKLRFLK